MLDFASDVFREILMNVFTRGNMDGLTSLVFLTITEDVTKVSFVHPKDMQDGLIEVSSDDIIVNLPYAEGCALWFDHHISEEQTARTMHIGEYKGRFENAPSTARVIYNYYKHPEFERFKDMLEATDRVDSAQLTLKDVTQPEDWVLLAFTLDPRSGLGPEFRKYFRWLVEYVKEVPLDRVLNHREVKKRADRFFTEQKECKNILNRNSRLDGSVIITDLRDLKPEELPAGNRFLVYTIYLEAHSEVRTFNGKMGNTVIAAGHSIFNKSCSVNIGEMLKKYGGGGHLGAGTCQVPVDDADGVVAKITAELNGQRT